MSFKFKQDELVWVRDNGSDLEFSKKRQAGFICLNGDIFEDARLSEVCSSEELECLLDDYYVCEKEICYDSIICEYSECLRIDFRLKHKTAITEYDVQNFSGFKYFIKVCGSEFIMDYIEKDKFRIRIKCK